MKYTILFSIVTATSCSMPFISTAQVPAPTSNRQGPDGGLLSKKEVSLRNVHSDRLDFKYSTDGGITWTERGLLKANQLSITLKSKGGNIVPLQLRDADNNCPILDAVLGGYEAQIQYTSRCLTVVRLINRS
jgi:hypothetical protein